ncbi:cytochrome P450 315a1, mitochondrial [Bacillus rossius redtenbacheri]|uniref:cytochrome P450 315a1, mitochondrial n=1 Tax=Bacillus rossius redtenbacheri TaxID=93214 RepID=UPI002FDDDF92
MPRPRGLPLVGSTLELLAAGGYTRLHEFVHRRHAALGPVFQDAVGPATVVFVSDAKEMRRVFSLEGKHPSHVLPEAWLLYNRLYGAKRGLFFMEGEEWWRFRRVMNRLMLRSDGGGGGGGGGGFAAPCQLVAQALVEDWGRAGCAEVRGLQAQLYQWSLSVILAVLMGEQYSRSRLAMEPLVTRFAAVVQRIFQESSKLALLPPKMAAALRLPVWRRFVAVVDEALSSANELVTGLIPRCRGSDGLLGAMLSEDIEHPDLVRIVADLILAAGDTTAYTMQWILYLVARHPGLQERLHAEAAGAAGPQQLLQLQLPRGVMREALRLYPVAPFLSRYLPHDCQLGGYPVPAGQLVVLSLYTSGRDPAYFPEPASFLPQRWGRDAAGGHLGVANPHASLPFAMGARSCIGRRLAEAQIVLALAEIVKKYKLSLADSAPVDMVMEMVSVPSRPIRLLLTER